MNWYKLEDIKELAAQSGMRTLYHGDCVYVFLGEFRVSIFRRVFMGAPQYELLCTYTNIIKGKSNLGDIDITGFVGGNRFFGTLHVVYENMNKKYRKLKKEEKTNEIKACGGEYVVG